MEVVQSPKVLQEILKKKKKTGNSISVVPTMGALHDGHLSLVRKAKELADIVVITLFVNPTQFAPTDDLDKYPRPFDRDCALAQENGADYMFAPTDELMYPKGYDSTLHCGGITERLEGASRPGHFDGVTTVVAKLFNITVADVAVFGQKDAQQVLVLKKMVEDLNMPVEVVIGDTVREADGLAMSSRNKYLTPQERKAAPILSKGLFEAKELFNSGEHSINLIKEKMNALYETETLLSIEYISFADKECYELSDTIDGGALLSLACRTAVSNTRLIDNVILGDL